MRVTNPTGHVGIVGVYMPQDPGGVDPHAKKGEFQLPWGQFFNKGLEVGQGQAPVKKYNVQLRDLIIAGKAKPGAIVSHRLPLAGSARGVQAFRPARRGLDKGRPQARDPCSRVVGCPATTSGPPPPQRGIGPESLIG